MADARKNNPPKSGPKPITRGGSPGDRTGRGVGDRTGRDADERPVPGAKSPKGR